jgi:FixJ family two-component response regulator
MTTLQLICVVDDDESVRESLPDLLRQLGYDARAFCSAEEFLSSGAIDQTACLILDITMPGMSGPTLQEELQRRGMRIPIILFSAQSEETLRATALAQGAIAWLAKPFTEQALLEVLAKALPTP